MSLTVGSVAHLGQLHGFSLAHDINKMNILAIMKRTKKPRGKRNKIKIITSISEDKKVITITPNPKTLKNMFFVNFG